MTGDLEAIVFDFGGVLTKPARIIQELRGYDRLLSLPEDTLLQTIYGGAAWEAVSRGEISEQEHWALTAIGYQKTLPAAFSRFVWGTLQYEELNVEVIAIARRLKERYRLGLLSNATISLRRYLERLPVLCGLFDEVIISAEVGLRKPDPQIYHLTADRLCARMERILLIDDKKRNTTAGEGCGMQAIPFLSADDLLLHLEEMGIWRKEGDGI